MSVFELDLQFVRWENNEYENIEAVEYREVILCNFLMNCCKDEMGLRV